MRHPISQGSVSEKVALFIRPFCARALRKHTLLVLFQNAARLTRAEVISGEEKTIRLFLSVNH